MPVFGYLNKDRFTPVVTYALLFEQGLLLDYMPGLSHICISIRLDMLNMYLSLGEIIELCV